MLDKKAQTFSELTLYQKEALGLLSIGTFLEYFDLMLYVHMAVLLNELFFPQTDPYTNSILSAFAFCSTYVLRPVGALIFGYIGDHIGRKATVVLTTMMMSISCLIMAILPTYAQIGIAASWGITICRMIQGLSTMGEVIGANIYLTEMMKPPMQYVSVGIIALVGTIGGIFALLVASIVTSNGFNWRYAFVIGALIAIVGAIARNKLRETKDFADAKQRTINNLKKINQNIDILKENIIWEEKIPIKTSLALFSIECSWPACFYFAYIYCGNILKYDFNFTASEIIFHNLYLSIAQLFAWMIVVILSYKINPLQILKFIPFIFFIVFCPLLLSNVTSYIEIFIIQLFTVSFGYIGMPAMPVFYKMLPIFKRFTYAAFAYALSRAVIYIITAFGIAFLTNSLGYTGLTIIMFPIGMAYYWGISYFENLENIKKNQITW